ncbi:MAG TPA: CDP-alcohol phosphatidyltransferase family protein [Gaiellaceae bacterium]|nr:CDP-alcohol phosphatidyltransferase family protein [Gaiellaceae bacterium]
MTRIQRHLPNALTALRFALVPLFVVLMVKASGGHSWPAGVVFAIAGVTDQIDGLLARRWEVQSEFGKYADPLADRLMIDAAVLLLFVADRLPWAAIVIVFGRDVLLIVGARVVAPRGYEFSVNLLGKTATWILYLAVGCVIVTFRSDSWPLWIFWAGVGLAIAAALGYGAGAWRALGRRTGAGSKSQVEVDP